MPKFRKKPVMVDAMQWDGKNHRGMWEFLGGSPDEYIQPSSDNFHIDHDKVAGGLIIKTKEGDMAASIGDYVIREPFPTGDREFYPCKPDIFNATYEAVD